MTKTAVCLSKGSVLFSFALLSQQALAEGFFENSYIPKPAAGEISFTNFDKSEIRKADNSHFSQRDFKLKMPLGKSGEVETGLMVYGFNYRQRSFHVKTPDTSASTQLYNITTPLTYVRKTKDRTYVINASPGLSSDLDKIELEDFAGNAAFQILNTSSDIKYSYGLVYTHAFGKGELLPMASASFITKPNWIFTVGFPITQAMYAPNDSSNYYAKLTPNGGSWHAYTRDEQGRRNGESYKFRQVGYRASLGGQWNLTGPLWLSTEGGIQFGQELHFVNTDNRTQHLSAENTHFAELGLNLRFK